MHLNTELGFVVESPEMAFRLQDGFDTLIRQRAAGALVWIERDGDREIRYDTEPGTTFLQRASIAVLARLPWNGFFEPHAAATLRHAIMTAT